MTRGSDVFISYSRHDRAFVGQLTQDLRARGLDVWIDVESISAGERWDQVIGDALKRTNALIVVLSPAFTKSRWMLEELRHFVAAARGRVLPVLIEDVPPDELPAELASIQWADFRDSYDAGLEQLLAGLGADRATLQSVPQPTQKSKGYAFLSYAEEDADFVGDLKAFMKERGYAYWDYEESDRDYHSQLSLELEGVIREASATLCVLSEAWKRSQWTVREFFFSGEVATPVFLLRAKPLGPTLAIAGLPYIDFTDSRATGFAKLQKELQRKGL